MLDGTKGKKTHKGKGHHLSGIFERFSAAKKYYEWRTSVIGDRTKNTSEYAKAPRQIRLIEHEPCGPKGEAGRWADNVKSLRNMLRSSSRGTHITLVVGVPGDNSAAGGTYIEWYNAILALLREFPENFAIKIESESITNADPSVWYPKDDLADKQTKHTFEDVCFNAHYGETPDQAIDAWETAMDNYKDVKRWRHDTPAFVKFRQDSIDRMNQGLCDRDIKSLVDRRQVVDDNFAVSLRFLNQVRHFQENSALPGETLPGHEMPDGKIRPANRVAPSGTLFQQITKGVFSN